MNVFISMNNLQKLASAVYDSYYENKACEVPERSFEELPSGEQAAFRLMAQDALEALNDMGLLKD